MSSDNGKRRKKARRWYAAMALSCSIPLVVLGLLLAYGNVSVKTAEASELITGFEDVFTSVGVAGDSLSVNSFSFAPISSKTEENVEVVESKPGEDLKSKYASMQIEIPFGDTSEVIDNATINKWVKIEGDKVSINEGAVREYVNAWAKKHDTMGQSRKFHTASGYDITVKGGNYGWWTNKPETAAALVSMLKSGEGGKFEPVYYSEARVYGNDDIGSTYVEVDLDAQQVYVYKNGSMVVKSDCVSGKVANGNATPNGTYAITYKERDSTLVGEGYQSSVKYWMPFNGNIGLHDASWREEFGGDLYLNGGSHGCVNLPPSKAKEIYDVVEKGEAVIVHGGKQAAPAPELTEEEKLKQLQQQQEAEAAAAQAAAEAEAAAQAAEQEQQKKEEQQNQNPPADQNAPAPNQSAPAQNQSAPDTQTPVAVETPGT